jgi:hypothetical protein
MHIPIAGVELFPVGLGKMTHVGYLEAFFDQVVGG